MIDTDDLDYKLTKTINRGYGIGIENAQPVVTGASIPKLKVVGNHTTNMYVEGTVKTPLRLTHMITTVDSDLVISPASGSINANGAFIVGFSLPAQSYADLAFLGAEPLNVGVTVMRLYADSTGRLVWRTQGGPGGVLDAAAQSADRTFTFPDASMEIMGTISPQTFTGQTIANTANTVLVGGVAIGVLVGQDVRTTSGPQFVDMLATGLTANVSGSSPLVIDQSSSNAGNDLMFQQTSTNIFGVGTNEATTETYTWNYTARDYKIGTNNTERLRVASTGIANNNATTNILGLQGTTLVYKNTMADTNTVQTFTNKVIDSASNTLQVNGTAIGSLIDQDVRTSATPTFSAITSANAITEFAGKITGYYATTTTTTSGTFVILPTVPTITDTVSVFEIIVLAYGTVGSMANTSAAGRLLTRVMNVAGVVTVATMQLSATGFATGINAIPNGANADVIVIGFASNTIRWSVYVIKYDE